MSKREPRKRPLDETAVADEPVIDKRYLVEKIIEGNLEKLVATVVHTEYRCEDMTDDPEENEKRKTRMYYVHYETLDRRNDEWVTKERIRVHEAVEAAPPNTINVPEDVKKDGAPVQTQGALTRSQRRELEEFAHMKTGISDMDATTARLEREHEERTKVKNVPRITIGKHTISSWYYSPFPPSCENHELYMCEYCLLYSPSRSKFREHYVSCRKRQPPGNEIYRKGNISVWEVDGSVEKLYCQCLCLLSKLFMDHKTLYFDVDDFMFYVLCE
uniref:Histone acetyltransferase n=1 Tax=Caenorhabditis japonica TaxID=281687 RepID=A0A8R1HWX0_CAEJA